MKEELDLGSRRGRCKKNSKKRTASNKDVKDVLT